MNLSMRYLIWIPMHREKNRNRKRVCEMLTLEKFEEASEIVKKVTQETKLIYSDYFSSHTGNKVYLKPKKQQARN